MSEYCNTAIKSSSSNECPAVLKSHVALLLMNSAIISSLSSGTLTYQPRSSTLTPQTRRLPSPLTCFQTVRSSSSSSGTSSLVVPSHFIAAGKEVEVSLWDLERTLAVKSTNAGNSTEAVGAGAAGQQKKRKKDQLEVGEVWRAKNVSCATSYRAKGRQKHIYSGRSRSFFFIQRRLRRSLTITSTYASQCITSRRLSYPTQTQTEPTSQRAPNPVMSGGMIRGSERWRRIGSVRGKVEG